MFVTFNSRYSGQLYANTTINMYKVCSYHIGDNIIKFYMDNDAVIIVDNDKENIESLHNHNNRKE